MSKVGLWSTTAGNNNSTPPDGWPEGQAPSTVNDCARELMAAVRTVFNDAQFFDHGLSPTFVNATSFTLVGNQTAAIHAGRRLKLFDATTVYATVVTASFTAVTTIQLTADAATLTSSLSSFALAILSNTNPALPQYALIPVGMIALWHGSTATIPLGWALCDGNNGTPDLRNRFIVGAGSTYAVSASGGTADLVTVSHTHTANTMSASAEHSHTPLNGGNFLTDGGNSFFINGVSTQSGTAQASTNVVAANHAHSVSVGASGVSGANMNLPPYFALAYIMKL